MEKYNFIELIYYIVIFMILVIDLNNYKLAKNYIDKFYISYLYYIKDKWKYYYKFYIKNILLLLITFSFYHYISLFIIILIFTDSIVELSIIRKIMENIKLKSTRTEIKSPSDIIDMIHISNIVFDIEDIKYKYEKGELNNNYLFLLPYLLIFTFIIIEHLSIIQFTGGV